MPNVCNNKVTIIGHVEDLDLFEEEKLSFLKFVPRPAEEEHNWYEWNNTHWGTKWESWDYELVLRDENIMVAEFCTAWGPPIEFLKRLLPSYPRCWIKCQFNTEDYMAGIWIGHMKAGACVENRFMWDEPPPFLTTDGEIYIPGEDEDAD